LVTWPDDVTSVSGKAKNARNAREWPSRSNTLRALLLATVAALRLDLAAGFLVFLGLTLSNLPVDFVCSNLAPRDLGSDRISFVV
jgi:hypothetical protein